MPRRFERRVEWPVHLRARGARPFADMRRRATGCSSGSRLPAFGGQFKQVMSAADRSRGWTWATGSKNVASASRLPVELTDPPLSDALTASEPAPAVKANASDISPSTRTGAHSPKIRPDAVKSLCLQQT